MPRFATVIQFNLRGRHMVVVCPLVYQYVLVSKWQTFQGLLRYIIRANALRSLAAPVIHPTPLAAWDSDK